MSKVVPVAQGGYAATGSFAFPPGAHERSAVRIGRRRGYSYLA